MNIAVRILFLSLVFVCAMCKKDEPDSAALKINIIKLKSHVESKTQPFSPLIFKERHVALVYPIRKGVILDSLDLNSSLVHRIGKMPLIKKQGTFKVTYKDSLNNELGLYKMLSPLFVSIEVGNYREVRKVINGHFQVPLPKDKKIATVILEEEGRKPVVSDVRKIFQKLKK